MGFLYQTIFKVLMVIFSTQIIKVFLDTFYVRKKSILRLIPWGFYCIFQYCIISTNADYPVLFILANILFIMMIIMFAYQFKQYKNALYLSVALVTVWMLVEVITYILFQTLGVTGKVYHFLMGNAVSKILIYIIVNAFKKYRQKVTNPSLPNLYWIRLLVIPLFTIIIIHISYLQAIQIKQTSPLIAIIIIMVTINFILFDVYDRLGTQNELERMNLLYQHQFLAATRQTSKREQALMDTQILRHDLKQYLIGLKATIYEGSYETAIQKIDLMLERNNIYQDVYCNCGNIIIDTLINETYSYARADSIPISSNISVPPALPFDDIDLCIVLGNLLDNAVEANRNLLPSIRKINISIIFALGILSIEIANPMTRKSETTVHNTIFSTKPDPHNHGLGLISVRHVVDNYHGELVIQSESETYTATVSLYAQEENLQPDA